MKRILALVCVLLLLAASAMADTVDLTDRSEITDKQITALIEELSLLPEGTEVNLMNVKLSLKGKSQLAAALPQLVFRWTVEIGSYTADSLATTLNLDGQEKRAGYNNFSLALGALPT